MEPESSVMGSFMLVRSVGSVTRLQSSHLLSELSCGSEEPSLVGVVLTALGSDPLTQLLI